MLVASFRGLGLRFGGQRAIGVVIELLKASCYLLQRIRKGRENYIRADQ